MKNVAIIWGGYSSERIVSAKSAEGLYSFIDKERYNLYKVRIDKDRWSVEYNSDSECAIYEIDKNDFSFRPGDKHIVFDFAYITIHGTPGEDGLLEGYFEMMNIPYSCCSVLTSALTFDKYRCNNFLKSFNISVADSVLLRNHNEVSDSNIIVRLGLPLFIKPNKGGSSFATTKVKEKSKLRDAIALAFDESDEVIIEQYISGTEVTCGCYESPTGIVALPVTEVVTHNEFFDYDAKYHGQVEEITPARISEDLTNKIQEETKRIYRLVGAKGIVRADYIIKDKTPYFLELNTTPGMTDTSFIPQQIAAAGRSITDVLTEIIELEYSKINK